MAAKEIIYAEQLKSLGIYSEAFDGAIHELCIMERELRRARAQLKKTYKGDDYAAFTDPLYSTIRQLQTSILSYRDSLGLTPKGMQKLKGRIETETRSRTTETPLSRIQKKHEKPWKPVSPNQC